MLQQLPTELTRSWLSEAYGLQGGIVARCVALASGPFFVVSERPVEVSTLQSFECSIRDYGAFEKGFLDSLFRSFLQQGGTIVSQSIWSIGLSDFEFLSEDGCSFGEHFTHDDTLYAVLDRDVISPLDYMADRSVSHRRALFELEPKEQSVIAKDGRAIGPGEFDQLIPMIKRVWVCAFDEETWICFLPGRGEAE